MVEGERFGFWVVCEGPAESPEPLTVSVPGIGEALGVFSFEEEADLYLHVSPTVGSGADDNLRARPVGAGALLALLCGPWSRFARVALDPMPEWDAGPMLRLASVCRGDFIDLLSDRA